MDWILAAVYILLTLTAPVKCQTDPQTTVQCRVDRFCDQTPGVQSILEDCCNHDTDPPGLAYTIPGVEGCQLCPVAFGFNQTTFVGVERGESYTVEVGFLSGSPADAVVSYSIEVSHNTTSFADVSLSTSAGRFFPVDEATNLQVNLVTFTLIEDAVPQEENETFSILLNIADVNALGLNPTLNLVLEGTILGDAIVSTFPEETTSETETESVTTATGTQSAPAGSLAIIIPVIVVLLLTVVIT